MVYPVVKVEHQDLKSLDFDAVNPAIYEIMWDGVKYEMLINHRKDSNRAVVFGTGAVAVGNGKQRYPLPYFTRCSWADLIDATCIYYQDPTLYLSETCTLTWGYGVNQDWYLERIAFLLKEILEIIGSGGGGIFPMFSFMVLPAADLCPSVWPLCWAEAPLL